MKYEQTSLVPAVVFSPPGVVLCQAVVFLPSLWWAGFWCLSHKLHQMFSSNFFNPQNVLLSGLAGVYQCWSSVFPATVTHHFPSASANLVHRHSVLLFFEYDITDYLLNISGMSGMLNLVISWSCHCQTINSRNCEDDHLVPGLWAQKCVQGTPGCQRYVQGTCVIAGWPPRTRSRSEENAVDRSVATRP